MSVSFSFSQHQGLSCEFQYKFKGDWPKSETAKFEFPAVEKPNTLLRSKTLNDFTTSSVSLTSPVTTLTITGGVMKTVDKGCLLDQPQVKYRWSDALTIQRKAHNCKGALSIHVNPSVSSLREICDDHVCDIVGLKPDVEYTVWISSPDSQSVSPSVSAKTLSSEGKCATRGEGRRLVHAARYNPRDLSDYAISQSVCGLDADVKKCISDKIGTWSKTNPVRGFTDEPMKTCQQCFGDSADCGKNNCLMKCILGPRHPSCLQCMRDKCQVEFHKCTGLPPDQQAPEPEPSSSLFSW